MKAITALLTAVIGSAVIAGCGFAATHPRLPAAATELNPQPAGRFADSIAMRAAGAGADRPMGAAGLPVRYRTIEYSAEIFNAGLPGSFTAFVRVSRTKTIQPSSAASIDTFAEGAPGFTSAADRARWQAAGSPSLAPAPPGGQVMSVPAGQFSFIPQGSTLTYQQARALPGSSQGFSAQLLSHLRAFAGPHPLPNLVLTQLAYLIAAAPVTPAALAAAWRMVATLPGLHRCGNGTDLAGRPGQGLCIASGGEETEVLVSPGTGSVLAVEDRLLQPSRMYPMVADGSMVSSATFLTP